MNLNVWYCTVFTKVYECLNMSVVAENLFITQPAISRIIREMEQSYETRFFLRHGGKLYRTEAGKKFYPYAKEIIAIAEQAESSLLKQNRDMKVDVGATPSLAYYLPAVISKYKAEIGALDIILHVYPSENLEEKLRTSQLDFAVVTHMQASPDIQVTTLVEDELCPVTAKGYEVPDPVPFLILDNGSWQRQAIENVLVDQKIPYVVQGVFCDFESIRASVVAGLGVGIMPSQIISWDDRLQKFETLETPIKSSFYLAYLRKKFLFPELVDLLKFVTENMFTIRTERD